MVIRGCKTIAEYKQVRDAYVKAWFNEHFDADSCWYEITGLHVIVTDRLGESMRFELSDI